MNARAVAMVLLWVAAAPAAADIFSPGELSRPHAAYGGLGKCTQCHPQGQQLSQGSCLACHEELKGRLARGQGLHGRLPERERDCWSCHHEHQGRDFALVDWGPAGKKGFDHSRTGLPLKGKHRGVDCGKCHQARRIADRSVRQLLERQPGRQTFLGAPPACAACHADEHRGQVGTDCAKCHDESAFKPAPLFDHGRTAYSLLGRHRAVACDKCHARAADPAAYADLRPVQKTFLRFKPVRHESCADCHKDPHQNRFGPLCARCHSETDWKTMASRAPEIRGFHDKTRFPLEGAHARVACKTCHGPFPGEKAVFRGLAFAACTDCHLDGHGGQMRVRAPGACERCHTVQSFEVARYGPEEHRRTRYPLEGAHRTVPCASCHQADQRLAARVPAAARQELARRGRPVQVSLAVYAIAGDLSRCETCHADPHGGQFDARARGKGCTACHQLASFARTAFDHGTDTKFPLEGKHARTACASCHPAATGPAGKPVVRYAGVEVACAGCHADAHASQFARGPAEATDCARCHGADGWKQLRFRHQPPFTDFRLTGKHLKAECQACHLAVRVAAEATVRRYRGVPATCQGCHADFHRGRFRGFEP